MGCLERQLDWGIGHSVNAQLRQQDLRADQGLYYLGGSAETSELVLISVAPPGQFAIGKLSLTHGWIYNDDGVAMHVFMRLGL